MKITLISIFLFGILLAGCMLTTVFQTPSISNLVQEEELVESVVEEQSPESTTSIISAEEKDLPEAGDHGTVLYVSPASTNVTGFISVWFDLKEILEDVFEGDTVRFYIDVLQIKTESATVTMNIYEETSGSTSLTVIATSLLNKNTWTTVEGSTIVPDLDDVQRYLLGIKASEPATLDFYIDNLRWEVVHSQEGGAI
ncbi:carbohydrate-binding protein [Thermotoga sp. SG1]|uniref:carbohydrate-binding protein n=1 Tax=Thermotoga sp. SG1 TaxID=126739 RepID=UPI000C7772D7|nr:carbohydrate-binding protein [Thermotoga sp. SG1]PLV57667.1 carbohydrate-binding protein [Thermotoga sp. SG1]